MRTLSTLPPETVIAIASYLNSAADYLHFSFARKSIRRVLNDEHTIAKTLKRVASNTAEYRLVVAGRLSAKDAIRKLYDRQQAFANSRPASVIRLGEGSSFLYRQGLLVYVRGRLVRVLNVHDASRTEGVVLSNLVGPQILGIDSRSTGIELCNLQDGLLSVMFHGETVAAGWRSWLLVLDVHQYGLERERVRLVDDLWTSEGVVLRNDRRYLCAMSPTGASVNGRHREWVCKVWDLDDRTWRPTSLQIPDLAVGEIGQGLVFDVFDGFLYAISTQAPYELEEPEWTSYYSCFRFPLHRPHPSRIETLRIWRRHHKEGPINDLWTDLKLHRDEITGELFVMEARKEWIGGSSVQNRMWYRQTLPARFPSDQDAVDDDEEMADESNQNDTVHQGLAANQPQSLASSSASLQDPPYLFARPPDDNDSNDDPFSTAVSLEQRPNHPRLPLNVHPEYPADAPAPPAVDSFMLAKSKYRAYSPSAAAFLDLVIDDRQPSMQSDWVQQIRLRIGSRCETSPLDENGMIHSHYTNGLNGKPVPDSERRYMNQGIRLWPSADAPIALQDLINGNMISSDKSSDGTGCRTLGDITATSDERSIVYLVKEQGASEADKGQLILINFDEHIHFFHETWVPDFIDLYGRDDPGHNEIGDEPAEQITTKGMLKRTYEPMNIDPDDEGDGFIKNSGRGKDSENDELEEGGPDGNKGEDKIIPADDINEYFWCEEYDEDEPLDLDWFSEEMAMWTDIKEGYCFI
ncbi:MAG: hypothetical protein Q9170_002953 [Blastenia crenularia]